MEATISEWQYALYVVLAPLAALAAIGTLLYARLYRHSIPQDTTSLQWLVACLVGWVTFNTFELLAPSETATFFWARATYLFICAAPVAWLVFALDYTGRKDWLTPARLAGLSMVPAGIFVLALTNGWHGLIWREFELTAGLRPLRVITNGPAFSVCAAYGYILVAVGSILLLRQASNSLHLYRRQSRLMVIGSVIPMGFNMVYLFHLVPGLTKDYTPIGFLLASIVFVIGMLRYRLFQVKPIARDVVVDTLQDPVLILDTARRLVDLNLAASLLLVPRANNEAAGRLIGRPVEEVLAGQRGMAPMLPAECERRTLMTIDTEVEPPRAKLAGVESPTTLNGRRWYDYRTLPLTDPRGRPAGEVVVLHDVTSDMEAAAELRRRTEALEAQNQELNAFASTVAHDLKNPLTVIQSYVEMLTEEGADLSQHDVKTFLRAISNSTDWMAHTINELLLLARARQMDDVPLICLDMEDIVAESIEHLERQIHHAKARVTVAANWPDVLGYEPWVTQVWINYLSNALKYGGRPDLDLPPRVELGYDAGPASPTMRFWVRDQGPGIAPEQQAKLFLEFFRLPEDERRIRGHGLGLSIVQRIVHTLGGEVGVESSPGQGSTFWFTLPRAPVTAPGPILPGTPLPRP